MMAITKVWSLRMFVLAAAASTAVILSLVPCWSGNSNVQVRALDGMWWRGASTDERRGFLYALDDCLSFDRTPPVWFNGTRSYYENRISTYYRRNDEKNRIAVQDVFEHFGVAPRGSRANPDRYGEEVWRSQTEKARLGFVEGYISCRSKFTTALKWTNTAAYYTSKIDDMYNVDDRFGEDAPEFTGAIAEALEALRDR